MASIANCPHCGEAISLAPSDVIDPVAVSKPSSGFRLTDKGFAREPKASTAKRSQAASNENRLLRKPWIFKSPDYIPPTQASPAQIAAAELDARMAFYKHRSSKDPEK